MLILGTGLAQGRRTVAAALRRRGVTADPQFSAFHQVLNRAQWSPLLVSKVLLLLLVDRLVPPGAPLEIVIDEHLERRWGPQITKRGHYRDPLRSSQTRSVRSSGLRWIGVSLLVTLPWTPYCAALPFLTILTTPPAVDAAARRRHKTVVIWAQQVVRLLRRWLPGRAITLIGDGAYSALDLATTCGQAQVTLLAPLRLDANLFALPTPRLPGQRGAPRVKGVRLPKLAAVLTDPQTPWTREAVPWYQGPLRPVAWCTGLGLWYHSGKPPVPVRWVLVRAGGSQPPRAFFQTVTYGDLAPPEPPDEAAPPRGVVVPAADGPAPPAPDVVARRMITDYQKRWSLEVTFEESRAHLGVETQRQWSDQAIARSTPALLGLYSLVLLCGQALPPAGAIPVAQAAWYPKRRATFSDVLASVRYQVWGAENICTDGPEPDQVLMARAMLTRLLHAVCY